MTYRQLQQALKTIRANGTKLNCKLNAKKVVLQSEYDRVTATQVTESLEDSILTLVAEGSMPIAEIRRKFPVSKEEMDKVLTQLHYSDRINLFTGEANASDYYQGVFLPGIPNPRTWAMPA